MVPMVVADPDLKRLCIVNKLLIFFQLIRLTLESKFCLFQVGFVLVIHKCPVCANFIMRFCTDCWMMIRLPQSMKFLSDNIVSLFAMF